MKIGLFGGSFNPPHIGHQKMAEHFLISGGLDVVFILVTPNPPHKASHLLAPYTHRLAMSQLAFDGIHGVHINTIEEQLPEPHYTFHTVQALKKRHPGAHFSLCLGQDSVDDLYKWYRPAALLQSADIIAMRRSGSVSEIIHIEGKAYPVRFINQPVMDVSSTQIRNYLSEGKSISGWVHNDVEAYIKQYHLYQR